jgi:hypothetical protein
LDLRSAHGSNWPIDFRCTHHGNPPK